MKNHNYFTYFIEEVNYWTINPYMNCSHKCTYCISRTQGQSTPWYSGNRLIKKLKEALSAIPKDIEIGIGGESRCLP